MSSETAPILTPVSSSALSMAFARASGAKVHLVPGDGWPDDVRYRVDCGSGRAVTEILFETSDAFDSAYDREFGDRREWMFFQLAEHSVQFNSLCFKCFYVRTRAAYAGWITRVKAQGLPEHLEKMIVPPPGSPVGADTCPIGFCTRTATHTLFFYDAEAGEWTKQLVCWPHGATWEHGEGSWSTVNRAAALLPREIDER